MADPVVDIVPTGVAGAGGIRFYFSDGRYRWARTATTVELYLPRNGHATGLQLR